MPLLDALNGRFDYSAVIESVVNEKKLTAMPGTFTELVERTGLHRQSVTNALKS